MLSALLAVDARQEQEGMSAVRGQAASKSMGALGSEAALGNLVTHTTDRNSRSAVLRAHLCVFPGRTQQVGIRPVYDHQGGSEN